MRDYLLLFDKNENLKRFINNYEFFKDEYRTTVNGEVVFEFRIKDTLTDIEREDKIGIFKDDGSIDLLVVDQIESETIYSTEYKVTCLHDFYGIQDEKAITQWESNSISIKNAITQMLEGTSYELGECIERALKPLGPYLFKNVLWCIQDIINEFGVEVTYSIELDSARTKIIKKKLNIVNALGSDTGIRCSTDLNVSKIKSVEKNKFYTVLYGCGSEYQKDLVKYKYSFKDIESTNPPKPKGLEYVEDVEAIAKYGRKIGIFEDGRIKEPELLLKYTWEALKNNNKPLVSYEMEIHDLKTEDGYEHLNFKLGDIIILHNTIDDSRAKFRIVEYARQVSNPKNIKITIGEQIRGLTSSGNGNSNGNLGGNNGGTIIDPGDSDDGKFPPLEDLIPDTLPSVPVVEAMGLWSMISLSWTYENKMYYNYEVYASRIKDFQPTAFHMVFSGQASSFLHEVLPGETWYYRARAINSHGSATDFSIQVYASTNKVTDGSQYFENASIKDALIGDLKADRAWVGKFKGDYIDAKNLSVTDGNGKKTLDIDSFGNISMDVTSFRISAEEVATQETVNKTAKSLDVYYYLSTSKTELLDGSWTTIAPPWTSGKYMWSKTITTFVDNTTRESTPSCIAGAKGEAYRVEIISSNGSVFKNGVINTTLSARVYNNEIDITDTINASSFKWTKINSDGNLDVEWNTEHFGGSKSVTITSEDIFARSSFKCDIDI